MGQELPLTLLHDPPLKDLRGVVRKDLHRLLQDDGAAVALLADEVDGGAGQLDPVLQGLLMDVKAVTNNLPLLCAALRQLQYYL